MRHPFFDKVVSYDNGSFFNVEILENTTFGRLQRSLVVDGSNILCLHRKSRSYSTKNYSRLHLVSNLKKCFTKDYCHNISAGCLQSAQSMIWCGLSSLQQTFWSLYKKHFQVFYDTIYFVRNGESIFTQRTRPPFFKKMEWFDTRKISPLGYSWLWLLIGLLCIFVMEAM